MKKILIVVGLVSMLIFGNSVMAQEKVGVINLQKALNDVEEGKAAKARLKSEFDAKQKTLDALQNDLKAMKDNLEKQKLVLSQDAMKQKEMEYRDKFIELQKKLSEFRGELQQKEAQYTESIIVALKQLVSELGARDKYTLIFEKGQDVVLYAPNATDLTPALIQLYNSKPRGK